MAKRTLTALFILALVIPAFIFGGWLLYLLIAIVIIGGGNDFLQLSTNFKNWPKGLPYLFYLCVIALLLIPERLLLPIAASLLLILLALPVLIETFDSTDSYIVIVYMALFYLIGSFFMHMYNTYPAFVWLLLLVTYGCDTGAYLFGRFFGKHKLLPRISPNKTWEGAIGGWLIGFLLGLGFTFLFISKEYWLISILSSILLPMIGQIGDLTFSSMKRHAGLKDFSNFLPGHGGILDRVDSLIFNIISFSIIVMVVTWL